MRLFFLSLPYPPDPARSGRVLHELARILVGRGHEVHVICSVRPNEGGKAFPSRTLLDGVHIHRMPATGLGRMSAFRRLLDYISYYLLALGFMNLCLPRPDLILTLTTPPYLGLAARITAQIRGCAYVQWVMDLYPDILGAAKIFSRSSLAYRFLEFLRKLETNGARLLLTLGPYMESAVGRYISSELRAEWSSGVRRLVSIPLCYEEGLEPCPDPSTNRMRAARGWRKDELVLMYSGNLGTGHRIEEFLAAARALGPAGPRWVFVSSTGARKDEVRDFAREHPEAMIQVFPAVPFDHLRESLCSADVHLVSLDNAWQGLSVPSKVQGIMAVGKPLIFVGGEQNEVAEWIRVSGAGWVVPENDVETLLKAVHEASDPALRAEKGRAARAFAERMFDPDQHFRRIGDLLEQLATSHL